MSRTIRQMDNEDRAVVKLHKLADQVRRERARISWRRVYVQELALRDESGLARIERAFGLDVDPDY